MWGSWGLRNREEKKRNEYGSDFNITQQNYEHCCQIVYTAVGLHSLPLFLTSSKSSQHNHKKPETTKRHSPPPPPPPALYPAAPPSLSGLNHNIHTQHPSSPPQPFLLNVQQTQERNKKTTGTRAGKSGPDVWLDYKDKWPSLQVLTKHPRINNSHVKHQGPDTRADRSLSICSTASLSLLLGSQVNGMKPAARQTLYSSQTPMPFRLKEQNKWLQ